LGLPDIAAAEDPITPLRWGIDNAGTLRILDHPSAPDIMAEFSYDLFVFHYTPKGRAIADNVSYIRDVDSWFGSQGMKWIANLEGANWTWMASYVDKNRYDWTNRDDGRHYWLFPDSLLAELHNCDHLLGLMYDEPAHMQNWNNASMRVTRPFMYDPSGDALEDAAQNFLAATTEVAQHHAAFDLSLYTEQVFPILFHPFSQAGFTAGTKILKENWSPVFIACAMGAAIQYDKELWITPDLWGSAARDHWAHDGYPGHTVDEYESSLLLAYHMGADCIYTENLAYDHNNDEVGSLVLLGKSDYTVTSYGAAAQSFINDYVPANPRRYSFRELRPKVVIIRQPDACWGQDTSWLPDQLFGNTAWTSTATTNAWLDIWQLLTRDVVSSDGLSWHAGASYIGRPYQVFCPLDGVVEFDHTAEKKLFQDAELIFLTGLGVSPTTLQAIEDVVQSGATCVGLPSLLPERVTDETGNNGKWADGVGLWVATENFLASHVADAVEPFLPDPDTIRYQFGNEIVTFQPTEGDMNRLSVSVETDTDMDGVPDSDDADAEKKAGETPQNVYVYKTIGERELKIHLDYPPDWRPSDKRPVIVFFFGGGWSVGTVNQFERQAKYLAGRGLVAARADYRVRSRDGVTPDKCVEDARSTVRWLRKNADRLGIDPQRLITSGGSAGGHLAACTALADTVDDESDDLSIPTIPQAMVLYNPVLDFTHKRAIERINGDEELARKISPTLHLHKDFPPALIIFGSEDPLKAHGDVYRAKAKTLRVRANEYTEDGQVHGFFNNSPYMERTLIAVDRFLVSLGYLEGEPKIQVPSK
jgi:acetyl esterase/lipase